MSRKTVRLMQFLASMGESSGADAIKKFTPSVGTHYLGV